MSLAALPSSTLDESLLFVAVDVLLGRVTLVGELDHCSAHLLTDAVPVLRAGPSPAWTVDAGGVSFVDGAGVTALLVVRQAALSAGGHVRLVAASRCVRRLIGVVGLVDVLPVVPDGAGALGAVRSRV
ncbi:STAS domain-containing protein [Blastococcus sp. SYSU D00813]